MPTGLHALAQGSRYEAGAHKFVYLDADGRKSQLTFEPTLQQPLQRLIDTYHAPLVQLVALDPATGRVLAAIESSSGDPVAADLIDTGLFPAASVFKVVTTSALLARGIDPDEQICFHGGKHRIASRELDDDERRDRRCDTLALALAHSANVAIAKLAGRNLDPIWLRDWAQRFLFDRPLPSDWPVKPSTASIPNDAYAFAQTAAGFGAVKLGVLHGAAIAAAIANHGLLVPLRVFETPPDSDLTPLPVQILTADMAGDLGAMMQLTVSQGTAHKAFRFRGAKLLEAAGKTGSLSDKKPYRDYSWFVGFAPASDPKIAVAALVVNGLHWKIHASALAAAALRTYLKTGAPKPRQLSAAR